MEQFYEEMEGKGLMELVEVMNQLRIDLEAAKAIKTGYQKKYDAIRLNLVPSAMDDSGITSMNVDGVGRVGLTSDIYASILEENRDEAWKWLRDNKMGDIIKETINAGTLKATIKRIMKKGELELPEDVFKITPFSRASITKK